MPTARSGCAAVSSGGLLYVFGGRRGGDRHTLAQAERYDPTAPRWEPLPPMPTPRSVCAAAAARGLLYVFGGRSGEWQPLACAERLDPITGRWETLPPMRTPRSGCATAAAAGMLYVLGGEHGVSPAAPRGTFGQSLATAERFCPATGIWETLPPMPTARYGCAAAAVNGVLYVFGGERGAGQSRATVERLDPSVPRWDTLTPMPTARSWCACVAAMGLLYVFGGSRGDGRTRGGGRSLATAERFDPSTGRWELLPPMQTPRSVCSGAVVFRLSDAPAILRHTAL